MHAVPVPRSRAERRAYGKSCRQKTPRSAQRAWKAPADRRDPLTVLAESARGRLPELLPTRYARMAASPFTYFRGAALAMANDLARTPVTGLWSQLCGDAHCGNFGGFATPEGNVIFDVNDFDETLPGPWEWDLKRLATSLVLAAQSNGLRARDGRQAALSALGAYRARMQNYTEMTTLEVWADRIDAAAVVAITAASDARRARRRLTDGVRPHSVQHRYYKLTAVVDGRRRIVDEPPKVFHPTGELAAAFGDVEQLLHAYRSGLRDDARTLLERYRLADWVVKVVGVGSVGTRCAAALFLADADDPLILQLKEATASVLEAFVGKSGYANHGERVVAGQRLMQSASDAFLGWTGDDQRSYYVRQLRVLRGAPEIDALDAAELTAYAGWCGRALAASHARAGDPNPIAGYLGSSDAFDRAVADFAVAYADQTVQDYARFSDAVKSGRIPTAAS